MPATGSPSRELTTSTSGSPIGRRSGWRATDEYDIALRDPETVEPDSFTEWVTAHENDYENLIGRAHQIGASVTNGLKIAASEVSGFTATRTYADSAGRVLARWDDCGHTAYFRQVTLERRERRRNVDDDEGREDWEEWFSAHLTLNNCLPSTEIAERLDMFGGGILMSATLAPLDVYQRVSGVAELGASRPVKELIYGLPFPEANRTSCAVDLTSFTWTNRGTTAESNETRHAYAEAIRTTARTTSGNVLVAMPSYTEAGWAADVLEDDPQTDKPVLLDQSSGVAKTETLKQEFFAGPGKVLVTGMRGTLTEGVDFKGDRLDAVIVCGVPIRSLSGDLPDAIELAYNEAFGKRNGFEYAFTVPAVRKARQAIGRVIRSNDDLGVRVLADERYGGGPWNDVREYLPPQEQEEFTPTSLDMLEYGLESFWEGAGP